MSTQIYDEELQKLNNLAWFPWVGKEYAELPKENKILFIGESHYLNENKANNTRYEKPDMTRLIVKDMGVDGNEWNSKFFVNLHRLIYGPKGIEKGKSSFFWDKIAFYNFIQRPMDSQKGRPSAADIRKGTANFLDLIDVLNPSVCVFLGLKAEFKMNEAIQNSKYVLEEKITWRDGIGTSWGRYGKIKNSEGDVIKLIFIRHPSSYFNPQPWHEFITKYMPSRMDWLKNLNKLS